MLISSLVSLKALNRYPNPGATGRPVQAWLLRRLQTLGELVKRFLREQLVDDEELDKAQKILFLIKELHKESQGEPIIRPYTVSSLLRDNGGIFQRDENIYEGDSCWVRITALDELLSTMILSWVLPSLPSIKELLPITSRRISKLSKFKIQPNETKLRLYQLGFRIDGYTINPREHPWAGQTTFTEIAQDSKYTKVSRNVRMEFVSPTAFRSNGNDIALPLPQQVFRSLWQKWNATCPESMQVDDLWTNFAGDCILVNELTAVNTVHWEFAEGTRGAATGFTGTVGFSLLPKTKVPDKWKPYWDGADVVMQSLARFAFYCGIGHHSTIGMGQTRVIPDRQPASTSKRLPPTKPLRR